MGNYAIKVEGLGKRYRIGERQQYKALRDVLTDALHAPARAAGSLFRGRDGRGPGPESHIWALKDASFEVAHGEVLGIIGRNGAGKSTLLKILSRITEPTEGEVRLRGRVGSLLEVGTGFHPELTGRENVYLNGAILGMRRAEIERKFDEIVAFAEIEKFLDTPVKHYSSGMYVRLAFAVAAHLEPEILLVDEVLAVGDAAFQKKCLGKMEGVAAGGRTVLFVSHNMTAVESLCTRSILLEGGKLCLDGTSADIIKYYLSGANHAGTQLPAGTHNLLDRRNPYSPGKLIAQGITLQDSRGESQNTFLMGQEMRVVVDVKGLSQYRDAIVGVTFKSVAGQWITSINTAMTCSHVDMPRRINEKAILRIPAIPFTPGSFWIDVSIAQQGIARLDYVENAARFDVVDADVYGSGYQVSRYFGLVYLEGTWAITAGA